MKSNWDVIVVGGGPAGSMSALHSAKYGASVLMLEKDREIGVPVRCAEGVGVVGLQKLIKVDERWIKTKIDEIDIISPNNTSVKVKFDNMFDNTKNFESTFNRYEDYPSSKDLSAVQESLIIQINEMLIEDIF